MPGGVPQPETAQLSCAGQNAQVSCHCRFAGSNVERSACRLQAEGTSLNEETIVHHAANERVRLARTPMNAIATLTIVDGVRVVVPNNLNLITPYVLAEQGDWFEDEIDFLRRVLQSGQQAIDIGANYGVYTLSMARTVGPTGAIWAFEPTAGTADYLKQGIVSNGFQNVTLECSALSNAVGTARLATSEHAELNSLGATAGGGETVRVVTLDEAMTRYDWRTVDFLKMDAEGEERRIIEGGRKFLSNCSPLVLYEVKASRSLHLDLVHEFATLGYESYRLVPGLDVLAPFDPGEHVDGYLLNLFCCKQDRAASLAQRGLLVMRHTGEAGIASKSTASFRDQSGTEAWEHLTQLPYAAPFVQLWRSPPHGSGRTVVNQALDAYLCSRDSQRSAADRLSALESAFQSLTSLCATDPSHMRRITLARVAAEFGARSIAVGALQQLMQEYAQGMRPDVGEPFLAVPRRFESVVPGNDAYRWVLASILEAYEELSAFSSYYSVGDGLPRLETINSLGYASAEMLRRLELVRLRSPATRGSG